MDVVRLHELNRANRDDTRQRCKLIDLVARDPDFDAVVSRLIVGDDATTETLDTAAEPVLRCLELRLDLFLLVLRESASRVALANGNRIAAQLHHDVDGLSAHAERRPSRRKTV